MQMIRVLTDHDIITLLSLASKVCSESKTDKPNLLYQKQLELLKVVASKVLTRLDKEVPAVIPVPADGKPWANR